MTADSNAPVPVWTLATEDVSVPDVMGDEGMTPARLAELRTALATLADAPIATLEAHPIATTRGPKGGVALHAASPLARQLSQLVTQTAKSAPPTTDVAATGDVLYRMVVPAKFAAQVGEGLVRPMAAKTLPGGVRGPLVGPNGILGHATFVPVAGKGAAGVTNGSASSAGVVAASGGALTVAAPLVLMAVAVSVSAHAEQQRQESLERITELLEQLHEDKLEHERSELDGCRDAIDKATSILLDQGRIGLSLGLDSAAHAIGTSIARTRSRLTRWQNALAGFPEGPVDVETLTKAFPGIFETAGTFRAHLELARLAIALKRRVLVLQAVEHAQLEGESHPFTTFVRTLQDDERGVDELESAITSVLLRLSSLELKRRGGFRSIVYTQGEVDGLLKAVYRLRALGDELDVGIHHADVAIEIERRSDGSLVVFPGVPA
ncbi:hypothetical protein [uncultured Kocuria sp.]|uniref:hypothetical protein n=1 Tax=uncultured Kocuria sp. TaxID=259305 RepID=UPI0026113E42|nr:hypothetical protein [uncultured Kocuria sp.]